MTWKHDAGQTDANDPVPPSLWLSESGSAQWTAQSHSAGGGNTTGTGKADDGIKDKEVADPPTGTVTGGLSSSANAPTLPPPGMHLFKQSVSGNTITLGRTFHADAKATVGPPVNGTPGGYTITAIIGDYRLAIHAQPYGWYDAGINSSGYTALTGPDYPPGGYADQVGYTLNFRYKWKSTSGNLGDLGSNIKIYEVVDYTGNPGTFGTDATGPYYRPSRPPIAPDPAIGNGTQPFELGNPEISFDTPTTGAAFDVHSCWPTEKPYSVLPVVAPQKYKFDDASTNDNGVVLYDVGSIKEGIKLNPPTFYITKSGVTVSKPLP